MPQLGNRFIIGEAGRIGGHFKQDAIGFAEIDGAEILPVLDIGNAHAGGAQLGQVFKLFAVIDGAEGDMVDGAGAHLAARLPRPLQQVNVLTDIVAGGG